MIVGTKVSVGTSATLLLNPDCDMDVIITCASPTVSVFCGDSGVTSSNGFLLASSGGGGGPAREPGTVQLRVRGGDSLYGIVSTGAEIVYLFATPAC